MDWLLCTLIKVANFFTAILFNWWIDLLIFFLSYLPQSPIQFEPIQWGEFGKAVGYFIPIAKMATHFSAILGALTIWFAIQHILRVLKMVR